MLIKELMCYMNLYIKYTLLNIYWIKLLGLQISKEKNEGNTPYITLPHY